MFDQIVFDAQFLDAIRALSDLSEEIKAVWAPRDERVERDRIADNVNGRKVILSTISGESLEDAFGKFYAFDFLAISYKVDAEGRPDDEVRSLAFKAIPHFEIIIEQYFQLWNLEVPSREDFCEYYYDNIHLSLGDLSQEVRAIYRRWDEAFCACKPERDEFLADVRFAFDASANSASEGTGEELDRELLAKMIHELSDPGDYSGEHWVYFKKWRLNDGTTWYKIGITNDLRRRDSEQNVLPVPSETIDIIPVEGREKARDMEQKMHRVLDSFNIKSAGNKELFSLDPSQELSISTLFQRLSKN